MTLIPKEWLVPCQMKGIIIHWTGGTYEVSSLDKQHYHIIIDGAGKLHRGIHTIDDNLKTGDGDYAAHTKNCNTGYIGVSVAAMGGKGVSPTNFGMFPVKKLQWDTLVIVCRELSEFYKIPITPKTVLSHAEVEKTLGIKQNGKWDIAVLPFDNSIKGAKKIGDKFRYEIQVVDGKEEVLVVEKYGHSTNKEALELIKFYEGKMLKAYKDPVGIWTIGYGHTDMAGPPKVKAGMVLTEKEAEDLLKKDLIKYEKSVRDLVKVPLNENQFGALVSFCYNLGAGNLRTSTLLKKINVKDFKGAAEEFGKWVNAGGRKLDGLVKRRAAEKALFLKATQTVVHNVKPEDYVEQPEVSKPSVQPPVGERKGIVKLLVDLLIKLFVRKQ